MTPTPIKCSSCGQFIPYEQLVGALDQLADRLIDEAAQKLAMKFFGVKLDGKDFTFYSGASHSFTPASKFGPEVSEWTCKACVAIEKAMGQAALGGS